jgi:hypothetical protein
MTKLCIGFLGFLVACGVACGTVFLAHTKFLRANGHNLWAASTMPHSRALKTTAITISPLAIGGDDGDGHTVTPDSYCGPRAIEFLLKYYGRDEELIHIIGHLQIDRTHGMTLADIQAYLESRGLYTSPVSVAPAHSLAFMRPAVLYASSSDPAALGHFVVCLPQPHPGPDALICDGLQGQLVLPWDSLSHNDTLTALIVSDRKVSARDCIRTGHSASGWETSSLTTVICALCALLYLGAYLQRRSV